MASGDDAPDAPPEPSPSPTPEPKQANKRSQQASRRRRTKISRESGKLSTMLGGGYEQEEQQTLLGE